MIAQLRRTAQAQARAAQSLVLSTQYLLMAASPHGMQLSARRNAWASMTAGDDRALARHEADEAFAAAGG